jgi:predicted dehydrogenase
MTDSKTLNIGVVGVGSLGQHHARILADLPGARLAAVCDANAARGAEIGAKYSVPHFTDWRDLPPLDGVVVAAPTSLHRGICEEFLASGVGVLCEKPMATTEEECRAILEARDRSGAPLLVGHIEHFNPGVEAIQDHMRAPGFLEVHRLGVFVQRSLDVDVVLDLMIHDIEIVQSLVRRPVERVEAVGVSVLTPFVDLCNARLVFEGGCVANLTASRISREKVRKLRVFQEDAYLSVDFAEQAVEYYRVVHGDGARTIEKVPVLVPKEEPLRCELAHFLKVLRRDEPPRVGGEAAAAAVAVARRILGCIGKPTGP